ncbi:vWA domain-containing protein [Alkalimarinus alittae]|uniref:VWA domain-containing protein n=1 Tax=Alkalimarinus alittae TaxID=2961619 RepID=A0ABY6N2P4_9ALTE|nr:VWA domain-containing protein [Alkalimarinus alittae]UZE96383.1 VWA domain-containing protein [Alkalimarinus alittae]
MTTLKSTHPVFSHKKPSKNLLLMALSAAALTSACSTNETQYNPAPPAEKVSQTKDIESRLHKANNQKTTEAKRIAHPLFSDSESPVHATTSNIRTAPTSPVNNERYSNIEQNSVMSVSESPVSTFSIDVDTASYANTRRFINNGQRPPIHAVRTEELINYFDYQYATPSNKEQPFSVHYELGPSPWNSDRTLLHVGIQGYKDLSAERPSANLVFLVDVSGSMNSQNKLPLVKKSLRLLAKQLNHNDRISLVAYAGAAQVVLEPTAGDKTVEILQAIDQLQAGGSTHGSAGIELAYQLGQQAHIDKGINRVMLATDGDFNVGLRSIDELKQYIEGKRKTGLQLSVLGYGTGNYNDALMEELSNRGNGNAAYIDNLKEAQKVLVDEIGSTLQTIASDVKLQMEFNPQWVQEYRLIGYENRLLNREDFNNDKVDAGDIGTGHSLTAIYELTLTGAEKPWSDALHFATSPKEKAESAHSNELGLLRIRYKLPEQSTSKLLKFPVNKDRIKTSKGSTSDAYRFASSVAGFSELLRNSQYLNAYTFNDVIDQAEKAKGSDRYGYRSEFIQLARLLVGESVER